MGAETGQFLHMHEAVLENRLGDARGAFGAGHQRHELRLKVGREAGEGRGGDIDRLDAVAVARNAQALRRGFDLRARFGQDVERGLEMFGPRALQQHVAAGHGGRHGVGAGLDAVGQHAMLGAVEPRDALDLDRRLSRRRWTLAPIFTSRSARSTNFRLARGVVDHCRPLGERGGHQGDMGAADRDLGKIDLAAAQAPAGRLGDDIAGVDLDRGAEALQRHSRRSTGRVPMAQPPGSDTRASPQRASSGAEPRNSRACATPVHRARWCPRFRARSCGRSGRNRGLRPGGARRWNNRRRDWTGCGPAG